MQRGETNVGHMDKGGGKRRIRRGKRSRKKMAGFLPGS